jgi:hypothetical protein
MELWGRNLGTNNTATSIDQHRPASTQAVLRELYELLEDYAPAWYTEEHHQRAAGALGELLSRGAVQ